MVFDPGTNTFAWGQLFGNGGGLGGGGNRPQSNFRVGGMPRAGIGNISSTSGGWGAYGALMGAARNEQMAAATDLKQQGQMFDQSLVERNMGLEHKYGMEQLQAQLEAQKWQQMMQMYAQGMALPSAEQIERSRGDLSGSLADYQRYADQGRYSGDEMNTLSQNAWNQINEGALGSARTMNSQLASMGLSSNPGAAQALGMAGKFAANAQRGNVMSDLIEQNKAAQEWGVAGKAGINSQMADYASRPINRMANFDPWSMMMDGNDNRDPRKKKTDRTAYGSGEQWRPQAGGSY